MSRAIELAQRAWGQTHPNPVVGCIIVHDNKVIAEGYHAKAGELHAERAALQSTTTDPLPEQAILYVTLEPCCTHGRTPPCTEIILERGIKKVVVGTLDPNPHHAGRGIDILKQHGVEVVTGVMESACAGLNPMFNHRMLKQRPMVAMKTAVTLDGKTVSSTGQSKWITSETARDHAMHWRKYFSSIAVGAQTALMDNPSLSIRENGITLECPTRLVFDRSLATLNAIDNLHLFNDEFRERTWLITSIAHSRSDTLRLENKGVGICALDYSNGFPIEMFLQWCVEKDLWGILLEGGSRLHSSFFRLSAVDYLFVYQAPIVFASHQAVSMLDCGYGFEPETAPRLQHPIVTQLGSDILQHGFLTYPD